MSSGKGQEKAADNAASTQSSLGNQYNAQQQQMYKLLFGGGTSGTGGSGSGGAVSSFLDPSSLNVTQPTGVYKTQENNADTAAGKQYASNASGIKSGAAQAGFGANAPAGFTQQQLNQNSNALADTRGANFSTATTNQYQDALKNFWNSVGVAQNTMNQGQQGAFNGANGAASTYSNLYGTASRAGNPWVNLGMGALKTAIGGGMGAAGKSLGIPMQG